MLRGALQKIDGCLTVLTACEVKPADKGTFAQLVSELRAFRAWLEQGLTAASIMKSGEAGALGKWC